MILRLPVKREYFEQIKSGEKMDEYRLVNSYWSKRIIGKTFDKIEITLGYPKKGDTERTITRPWKSSVIKEITHKHFGAEPVQVFAIRVN